MNIFLDTSSLFKLYHKEFDTEIIQQIFITNNVSEIFLSEIAKIEFSSTVWKKVRIGEISELQATEKIESFETDLVEYTFVQVDNNITKQATELITKYGNQGLRTLDSTQLSTAVSLIDQCDLFITTDKLLNKFFEQESLSTK